MKLQSRSHTANTQYKRQRADTIRSTRMHEANKLDACQIDNSVLTSAAYTVPSGPCSGSVTAVAEPFSTGRKEENCYKKYRDDCALLHPRKS